MSHVVSPRSSSGASMRPADVRELADVVREAGRSDIALRIIGAGHWLDAGRPVLADAMVDLSGMTGVVDYVPGDLTITARAGTPLRELQEVVRAHGQWIPLDPWGGDAGTLGATLATATPGPSAGAVGLPRDVVLGVEVVTGSGEVVRGGGRVVKNVAGFDLVRLMIGAWGTLGVITEATLRVRALPVCDESLALPLPRSSLQEWLQRLRHAPLQPSALELVSARLAAELDLGDEPMLLARVAGNSASVAAQRTTLGEFGRGAARTLDMDTWRRLREAEPTASAVCRFSAAPASLGYLWVHVDDLLSRAAGGWAHASVQRGVVRMALPAAGRTLESSFGPAEPFTRRFERLPASLWALLAPSRVDDALSTRVRAAFDPSLVLNPGILGDRSRATGASA